MKSRCIAFAVAVACFVGPSAALANPAILLNTRNPTSYDGAAAWGQAHAWPEVGDEWVTVEQIDGDENVANVAVYLSLSGVLIQIQSNGWVMTPVGNTDFVPQVDSTVQNLGHAGWTSDGTFFAGAHGWADWTVTANAALPGVTDGDLVSQVYLVATEVISSWDNYYHGWKTLVGTAGNLYVRAEGDWTGGYNIVEAASQYGGSNPLYGQDPLDDASTSSQSFSIGLNHLYRSWTPTSVGDSQTTGCFIDTAANIIGLTYMFNYSARASYSIHQSGDGPALAGAPDGIYIEPDDGGGGYDDGGYDDGGYDDGGYGDYGGGY